jgi:hypothetical protein
MPKIILPIRKINKESLTTKRSLILIGLTITAVCGGYLLFLAILAPQQLAEATTTAASNVVCSGCVGTTDIADNSILSADIANGRIFSEDIRDGQVGSIDIGTGQVTSGDIQDNGIRPNIQSNSASKTVERVSSETVQVDCPAGTIATGGGYNPSSDLIRVFRNYPLDSNTWEVQGFNESTAFDLTLTAYVICIGRMP